MLLKDVLHYDVEILTKWLRFYAGSRDPDHFDADKEGGLELQQIPEEYAHLLHWMKNKGFTSYLEIGVGNGGSFLLNVYFQKSLTRALAVDSCSYGQEEQRKIIEDKVAWLNKERGAISHFYPLTSDQFFSEKAPTFDCIFIDGDHSYEGVKRDYLNATQHLRKGGAVILHDIVSSICPGVVQLWKEIKRPDSIEFICGDKCGIGIYS